jgi:LmbE family N-acetylglucosaminyl deacetylase
MQTVIVISPHPDDEALGCGGTISKHADAGDDVFVIHLTSGEHGIPGTPSEQAANIREREAMDAAAILGVSHVEFLRAPDGNPEADLSLPSRLASNLRSVTPTIVYVPHAFEIHADHRAAFRLTIAAISALPKPHPCVCAYEVWTPLPHVELVSDITGKLEAKLSAIRAYSSQISRKPIDEACRSLARFRGIMYDYAGGPYSEAFMSPNLSWTRWFHRKRFNLPVSWIVKKDS